MSTIKFILWLLQEFIAMLWLMIMAVTIVTVLYFLVEIIFFIKDFFRHEEAQPQPGNAVGLHHVGITDLAPQVLEKSVLV